MTLADLTAKFYALIPLASGIYTGVEYTCPNDPRRKRRHAVLFDPPIVPPEYGDGVLDQVMLALNANEAWTVGRKWARLAGTTIETLTLVQSIGRSCCHFSIVNGEITT